MAVLDAQCRVRGVDSLRLIDSSVFPTINDGNLNARSIIFGEKAADMVLGRDPLAPSNAVHHWQDPDWRARQQRSSL